MRRSEGPIVALTDLPRSGRPVLYGARERAQVVATVCEILHHHQQPLSRFSASDLHRLLIREEGLCHLTHGSLARILAENTLKPWRYTYWLFPRDPDFISKACVVLDLYAGFWEGQRLGPDECLLSADEKTIQVLKRCHPGQSAIPGFEQRVEFEYQRLGTVAYLAAWDVFRGRILGRVASNTCIATFNQLIHQVMGQEPYRSSVRTFWVVDGGSAHHRSTFPVRLRDMYRQAVAVFLPVHSSWLNQIEIYFSIVHRKVLTPLEVASKEALTTRVLDFQDYYQETARPFNWRFTATDLRIRLDALRHFEPA